MNVYLHNGTASGKRDHVEREDDSWVGVTASHLSLVIFQINYYVGDASTLRERVAKESFEIIVNSRDNIVNNPVDEDQAVPDPQDSSICKILTSLAPYNCYFCQDNRHEFLSELREHQFQSSY